MTADLTFLSGLLTGAIAGAGALGMTFAIVEWRPWRAERQRLIDASIEARARIESVVAEREAKVSAIGMIMREAHVDAVTKVLSTLRGGA